MCMIPYAYYIVEFVLYIVCSLTLWSQWVWAQFCSWIIVLGSLEMHWWILLLTRKVVSPCAYRSKARTINEPLWTTYFQCYLGNKYLLHAYFSLHSTLCRVLHGMSCFIINVVVLAILGLQDSCLAMILVSSIKASQVSSGPLLLIVMSWMVLCGKFINILFV